MRLRRGSESGSEWLRTGCCKNYSKFPESILKSPITCKKYSKFAGFPLFEAQIGGFVQIYLYEMQDSATNRPFRPELHVLFAGAAAGGEGVLVRQATGGGRSSPQVKLQ